MTEQTMIQMDKDVIRNIVHFIATTDKINGYNEGQLKEGRLEIERLCNRIINKAEIIGGNFLAEQKLYVNQILNELK